MISITGSSSAVMPLINRLALFFFLVLSRAVKQHFSLYSAIDVFCCNFGISSKGKKGLGIFMKVHFDETSRCWESLAYPCFLHSDIDMHRIWRTSFGWILCPLWICLALWHDFDTYPSIVWPKSENLDYSFEPLTTRKLQGLFVQE